MKKYRVDRTQSTRVPCGMNSIIYLGDSFAAARREYDALAPGVDMWGQPNATYGVLLSTWSEDQQDYIVKLWQGLGMSDEAET